jgi:hypothetical protein
VRPCTTGLVDLVDLGPTSDFIGYLLVSARVPQWLVRLSRRVRRIIVHSIDLDLRDGPSKPGFIPPSTKGAEADDEFHSRLSIDSNTIAYKKQVHSSNHNATCFKYSRNG